MILEEALSPSGRTVKIVINSHTDGDGKAWFSPEIPYHGLMSACRQLRSEALPFLQKGIILDIKNDINHSVSIKKVVPKQSNRALVTAVFYELPEIEYRKDNTFRLLKSILSLPNLHTFGFKNTQMMGWRHDGTSDVYTYDQLRDYELDLQASGRAPELVLSWPDLGPDQYEDHIVVDHLFTTRPDVCIVLPYTVIGLPGCLGDCMEGLTEEEKREGFFDCQGDCMWEKEWSVIAIREPHKKTWRFIEDIWDTKFGLETETQVFARVLDLE